jgi:diguanylate cyclase (GGDEF)-like protein
MSAPAATDTAESNPAINPEPGGVPVVSPVPRREPSYVVLRVYNYYRVLLAFFLLYLFIEVPGQHFVGGLHPGLFQQLVFGYFVANLLIAVATLVLPRRYTSSSIAIFIVFCADIVFFGMLMFSSGGINSVLGNFLMVPVAFAGAMMMGRVALAVAAIATMVCLFQEFYLHITLDRMTSDNLVQAGFLGVTFFLINVLFQVLYRQLRSKDQRILMLERVRELELLTASTQRELRDSNSWMQALLQSAGDGVLGLEPDGTISFANARAGHLLQCEESALQGRNILEFFVRAETDQPGARSRDPEQPTPRLLTYLEAVAPAIAYDSERWQTAQYHTFYVEYSCEPMIAGDGLEHGLVVVFKDISERHDKDEELYRLANFDPLTGLANRTHFQHYLERTVARAERSRKKMAVLFLDMDNFKYVNDTFGHEAGDLLLQTFASRIEARVRKADMVARLGGDEFAVALVDIAEETNAATIADEILAAARLSIDFKGNDINGNLSIGIAIMDPEGEVRSASELLKRADAAMYNAKIAGGGGYLFFEPDMQKAALNKRRIQKLLEQAIPKQELFLQYQPIVKLSDRSIKGAEALLRWSPDDGDPVPPDVFVPIAESSGQIREMGIWVVREVCRHLAGWHERYDTWHNVAINISTRQLRTDEFRQAVQQALREYAVPADHLEIELTETGVIDDPKFVMSELNRIHDMGIRISIDDFGTGYSSLDYLRRLPLDYLKIDRSFTLDIGQSERAEELIKVMIAIAHTMGLQVIAEGIETEAQLRFLQQLHCDFGQGFLFGRPTTLAQSAAIYVDSAGGRPVEFTPPF